MQSLKELFTPCLVIDKSKLFKNIQRIKSLVSKRKINFRPHLKTVKCKEITKIFNEQIKTDIKKGWNKIS